MSEAAKRFLRFCCHAFLMAGCAAAQSENLVLREFPVKASQGVAVDAMWFYAISNTKISRHDKQTGEMAAEWVADPKNKAQSHFKHINSGTVVNGMLYCAHSRFPVAPNDCTVEVFDIGGEHLTHAVTMRLPAMHGSLTWIDRDKDGSWWMCYAVYGKDLNRKTKLVKCRYEEGKFIGEKEWFFPAEAVAGWGAMSCSGGSWGPDGYLYVTGHDGAEACVLEIDGAGKLGYVRTEKGLGLFGQAIAWDRFSEKPVLWGIVKQKNISRTLIPAK